MTISIVQLQKNIYHLKYCSIVYFVVLQITPYNNTLSIWMTLCEKLRVAVTQDGAIPNSRRTLTSQDKMKGSTSVGCGLGMKCLTWIFYQPSSEVLKTNPKLRHCKCFLPATHQTAKNHEDGRSNGWYCNLHLQRPNVPNIDFVYGTLVIFM